MPAKICEVCGTGFHARLTVVRTCGIQCRNRLIAAEKEAKHRHTKTCEVCSAEFEVGASDKIKRTCSDACGYKLRGSATSQKVQVACATCGTGFAVAPSVMRPGPMYCSKSCMYDRNKSATTRPCQCCGKPFSSPPSQMNVKTCSPECGYKIRELPSKKDKVVLSCRSCGSEFHVHESHSLFRKYCSSKCFFGDPKAMRKKGDLVSGSANPGWKGGVSVAAVSASGKAYKRAAPHVENEKGARRKRAKQGATPSWADNARILEFYKASRERSEATGTPHHVDHIVPLQSDLVCGLHSHDNMEILPAVDNLRRHNRTWPDMW